ncbi:hypothetical protein SDC9_88336 [bioreactor metagenome]|uniref:Uncharacterized protein n=1 Tax=bioreactor metagenome TaxID=1076179 RepID=A0A644ZLB3_9ZZZZ
MNTNNPTTGEIVRSLRFCADVNSVCGDACPAHLDEAGCRTVLMQNAADRLESQEREIERLKRENDALYRIGMGRDGVLIPKKEYEPIRFCKVPIADAIPMVEGFAALTARAEQAERKNEELIGKITKLEGGTWT